MQEYDRLVGPRRDHSAGECNNKKRAAGPFDPAALDWINLDWISSFSGKGVPAAEAEAEAEARSAASTHREQSYGLTGQASQDAGASSAMADEPSTPAALMEIAASAGLMWREPDQANIYSEQQSMITEIAANAGLIWRDLGEGNIEPEPQPWHQPLLGAAEGVQWEEQWAEWDDEWADSDEEEGAPRRLPRTPTPSTAPFMSSPFSPPLAKQLQWQLQSLWRTSPALDFLLSTPPPCYRQPLENAIHRRTQDVPPQAVRKSPHKTADAMRVCSFSAVTQEDTNGKPIEEISLNAAPWAGTEKRPPSSPSARAVVSDSSGAVAENRLQKRRRQKKVPSLDVAATRSGLLPRALSSRPLMPSAAPTRCIKPSSLSAVSEADECIEE